MYAHIPALVVVVPLIGAPSCMLLRYRDWSWGLALVCSWAAFVLSWLLLQQVMAHGTVHYALGGWVAPYGIEYRIDAANAFGRNSGCRGSTCSTRPICSASPDYSA